MLDLAEDRIPAETLYDLSETAILRNQERRASEPAYSAQVLSYPC